MELQNFEDIFSFVGGFGTYQWCVTILVVFLTLYKGETLYMNFIGFTPEHWCSVPSLLSLPYDVQKNIAAATEEIKDNGEIVYDSCNMFDLNYSSYSQDELLNWNRSVMVDNTTAVIGCQAWVYDQSVMVDNLVMKENIVCGESWKIDLISSLTLAGYFFGSLSSGLISDNFGRRISLLVMLVVKTVGGALSTFYWHYSVICVGRFIQGIGNIGSYVVAYVLLMEVVGPKYRTLSGTAIGLSMSVGYSLVPMYAYLIREELKLQILMTVLSAATLIPLLILPESPRWYFTKKKYKKSEKALAHMAEVNGRTLPAELDLSIMGTAKSDPDQSNDTGRGGKVTRLFRSSILRRRSLILYLIWMTTALTYFALSLNTGSLAGDVFMNTLIMSLVEIPANLISLYTMNVPGIGRRWSNAGALLIAGVASLIAVPLLLTSGEQSTVTTVMAMIGKAGATASFNVMYVFTAEIYPTEVRNIGLGGCSMAARIGGITAPFISGSLAEIWAPLPSLIFGVSGSICGILTIFLPETLGKSMPETIAEMGQSKSSVHPLDTTEGSANGKANTTVMQDSPENGTVPHTPDEH